MPDYTRKSLALLDDEHRKLEESLLNPEIKDKAGILAIINNNTGDWLTTIDNTVRVVKWMDVEEEFIRKHARFLYDRASELKERREIIRQAITDSMFFRNERKLKFPATGVSASVKELDPEITIEDASKVPDEFQKLIPAHYEVDLAKAKEYILKTGEQVPGFKIIGNRRTVVIR